MQHRSIYISTSYFFANNVLSICTLGEVLKNAIHSLFIKNIPKSNVHKMFKLFRKYIFIFI